jgi:hypothetical protein
MGEQEPLLGRPGDASQQDGLPLYHNLVIGMVCLAVDLCKPTILTQTSQALEQLHRLDPGFL